MTKIYLDNACTSFPKPEAVANAVYEYMTKCGSNINRGCYTEAYNLEEKIFETRQMLSDLFGGSDPSLVVFTKNITESLNTVIKGYLKPGDHVLVSNMEHNSVMRPLKQMGIEYTEVDFIKAARDSGSDFEATLTCLLRPNTKAVITLHASNVCGAVMPVKEIGEFAHKHNLKFILDTAQSAGVLPVNMEESQIDALCFTGHKGLLGPQGIGGFILTNEMTKLVNPLTSGGTGSISHTLDIPSFMPDRFEAGTLNLPGIVGLNAALRWINEQGIENLHSHEIKLKRLFLEGLKGIEGVTPIEVSNETGVVSLTFPKHDNSEIAARLDEEYGIMTRVGLHCSPLAHKALGTFPEGTVRFSFGCFNTEEDVRAALDALRTILSCGK